MIPMFPKLYHFLLADKMLIYLCLDLRAIPSVEVYLALSRRLTEFFEMLPVELCLNFGHHHFFFHFAVSQPEFLILIMPVFNYLLQTLLL